MPRAFQPTHDDPLGLFTDLPPHWIVRKGKPFERPCQTLGQANKQRKAVVKTLGWHGKRGVSHDVLALAAELGSCRPARPCLSGACSICERAQQRLLVKASVNALPEPHPLFVMRPQTISLVPDFGRAPAGELATFDIVTFTNQTHRALLKAGITHYILGFDVSLNHEKGEAKDAYWQFQWWGFFDPPASPWRERLKALVNRSKLVCRPVKVVTPDSVEAAAAYGLKSTFKRRVSYVKANLVRPDRGECRNTNDRLLRGDAWVELMLFLDRIGLERRLIGYGYRVRYQRLYSRPKPARDGAQ